MISLILVSLVFLAVHAVPATWLRPWIVSRVGLGIYLAVFSFVSVVLLVAMAVAYGDATPAPALWFAGQELRVVVAVAMLVPFWFAVAANTEPNPAAVGGGAVLETSAVPHGVFTITRHPTMIAVALWASLHLFVNPDFPSLVLFGTLIATALVGARLQDRRKEREIGASWRRYLAQTSFMPFAAVREGRARLDTGDFLWWRIAVTLLLWGAFIAFHGDIFGMPAVI